MLQRRRVCKHQRSAIRLLTFSTLFVKHRHGHWENAGRGKLGWSASHDMSNLVHAESWPNARRGQNDKLWMFADCSSCSEWSRNDALAQSRIPVVSLRLKSCGNPTHPKNKWCKTLKSPFGSESQRWKGFQIKQDICLV